MYFLFSVILATINLVINTINYMAITDVKSLKMKRASVSLLAFSSVCTIIYMITKSERVEMMMTMISMLSIIPLIVVLILSIGMFGHKDD